MAADLPPAARRILEGLSMDQRHALGVEARAALCLKAAARGDVLAWGRYAMPEAFYKPFCAPLHGHMVAHAGDAVTAMKAPRGFSKTTIGCNLIPLFKGLAQPHAPFDFFLNVQATDDKALAVNRAIKDELEGNEVLLRAYGDLRGARWTDAEIVTKTGVVFKAASTGASIRGIRFRSRRPNYIICDDMFNDSDIYNRESTIKKNDWLKSTLYKTLAQGKRTAFHVQGTAINKWDILEEMRAWPGCTAATFSAVDAAGAPIWAAMMDEAKLALDKERMGTVIHNREMLNTIMDESEAIVKDSWLNNWEYDPRIVWARGFRQDFRMSRAMLCCDPSTGENETNDPAGFATIVETLGPGTAKHWWIEDAAVERLTFDARLSKLERMLAQQNARSPEARISKVRIETIGGFKDFGDQAKKRTGMPVELVSFVKGKLANLASKSAHFENGKVHISSDIPKATRDAIREQLTTNKPDHDDGRDAVLLGLDDVTLSMRSWVG